MRSVFICMVMFFSALCVAEGEKVGPDNEKHWQDVIRDSPYRLSKGMFTNLETIRRWVLNAESYCEVSERHILFDRKARFLGYIDNGKTSELTQKRLNHAREMMAKDGRVGFWLAGAAQQKGYPFALSCDQPDANLSRALARYKGEVDSARLWGMWDGMRIGDPKNTVSLHKMIDLVYEDRKQRGRISLPESVLRTLAGTILIESGGRAKAHSGADARGILQLSRAALSDCRLAEKYHFHRMAQVDCALKLLEQNHRNLQENFARVFGHLEKEKSEKLYSYLLIQAYHGGVGRMNALLTDETLSKPALYFAKHAARYSAEDIALGMVYHNLGRDKFGFSSLYYVTDVGIAAEFACHEMADLKGCDSRAAF